MTQHVETRLIAFLRLSFLRSQFSMPNCFIEINRDALRHNFREIQKFVGATPIIAVVKSNAYGHGIVESARLFAEMGAQMLAVTRLEEAVPLRDAGISTPILLLTPPLPGEETECIARDLTCCVNCLEDAQRLSKAARALNITARVQLKIDTGMNRLGVETSDAARIATEIVALPNVQLEAAWTHFAFASESDTSSTRSAFAQFQSAAKQIEDATGIRDFHCANSAATLRFPEMRLSAVRPGTILYGQFPSDEAKAVANGKMTLRDGFKVCARVIAIRDVKAGETVGYGGEWRAKKTTRIATLGIGWADGLTMAPDARTPDAKRSIQSALKSLLRKPQRFVTWNGQRAPILGRIAMQQTSIDIAHLPQMEVGDVVSVSMRRLSANSLLPRVYVDD